MLNYQIKLADIPEAYTIPNFPFDSQRDNEENPDGACNVTSIAMCLLNTKIVGDGSRRQLADQLYDRCTRNGWSRHEALSLKRLAESYPGIYDDYTDCGTINDIKLAIANGYGCVLHGYFTRYGHIIVGKGYDKRGLRVNDPWGEWYPGGYDHSATGEDLHYSWNLIARLCSEESIGNPSNIWLHRIGRI